MRFFSAVWESAVTPGLYRSSGHSQGDVTAHRDEKPSHPVAQPVVVRPSGEGDDRDARGKREHTSVGRAAADLPSRVSAAYERSARSC